MIDLQIYDPTKGGVLTCSAVCTSEVKFGQRCGITLNRHSKRVCDEQKQSFYGPLQLCPSWLQSQFSRRANQHLQYGTATQEVNDMLATIGALHPMDVEIHGNLVQLASLVLCELQPGELASGFEGHRKDQREKKSPHAVLLGKWQDIIDTKYGHITYGSYSDNMDWTPTLPQQFVASVEMSVYT